MAQTHVCLCVCGNEYASENRDCGAKKKSDTKNVLLGSLSHGHLISVHGTKPVEWYEQE